MRLCGSWLSRVSYPSFVRPVIQVLLMAVLTAPLFATTIVAPTDDELIEKSSVIVTGTVLSSETVERGGELYTETRIEVSSVMRGSADPIVIVRQAGGRTTSRTRVVFGSPEYESGERVLLFLIGGPDRTYVTNDLFLGKFTERRTVAGDRVWYRPNDIHGTTLLDGKFKAALSKGDLQRHASGFETFIRDRADGRNSDPKYLLVNPELALEESTSFATMAETDIHRWFRFDDGGQVVWNTVGEQVGFDRGGARELETALSVWSSYSGARIRLITGGPLAQTVGASEQNGINEILFNDPFNEISGRWNGRSGVLAQAEYHAVKVNRVWSAPFDAGQDYPAKTFPEVWEIVEGNIVIQEGVSPFYRIGDVMLTQIIAHELGHTLGLAHSKDSGALMSSTIDGSGAFLREDDQLAVRWLYPVTAASAPPATPELAPVAVDFSVSKEFAEVEESLQLVDLTKGSPVSWQWSFGDGKTSAEKNPVHRYEAPGTYVVTLSASNGSFTSSRSRSVVVTPEPLIHSLIPVATQTQGAAGTNWRTELSLFNTGAEVANLTLVYLPQAGSDSLTRSIVLAPGESISYENALPELFGVTEGIGAIELSSQVSVADDTIRISSRTFTGADAGTYGQSVPHLPSPQTVNYITGIESTDAFRTNIGLVNRSLDPVSASITLFAADGKSLGSTQVMIEGRSFRQTPLTSLIPELAGIQADSLTARIEAGREAALYSYASVVDNKSNDPFLVPGTPSGSRDLIIPGVAHTPGSGGTFWKTDLTVFNPEPFAIDIDVRMLGQSNARQLTLEPGVTTAIRDIVQWLGIGEGQGALQLTTAGAAGPVVSTRTYTSRQADGATFGQWIQETDPREWKSDVTVTGIKADGRFRTNAGIVNAGTAATEVELRLQNDGATIAVARVRVEGKSQTQFALGAHFPGVETGTGATLTARSLDGTPIVVYASVVDNLSGDPTFLSGH